MPWQRVAQETEATLIYASLDKDFRIDTQEVLKQINENTKIVALTYVSNVMGYITDLKPIIKKAHAYGAFVIIDAAQAMTHIPVDVIGLDCDYLAFSAHKLFGPTGLGVLYGKQHLLKDLRPMEVGGGMVDTLTKTEQVYQDLPQRLEAGTPPIAEVIAFKSSLQFIHSLGFDKISAHINDIHTYALDQITRMDGVKVYNPKADIGIITFNIDGVHAHDAQSFFTQANIAVRTGHHCARLLQPVLGVNASIRASIHIYNSKEDIDALCVQIKHIRDFFRGLEI
jgi:cysteine desulfurase / selenocysteine lyase